MKDRLIEFIMECSTYTPKYEPMVRTHAEFLADHLLANGVIVVPVKVGDKIFAIPHGHNILEFEIATITIEQKGSPLGHTYVCWGGWIFDDRHWGKTVFLTREEAERALAERSGK